MKKICFISFLLLLSFQANEEKIVIHNDYPSEQGLAIFNIKDSDSIKELPVNDLQAEGEKMLQIQGENLERKSQGFVFNNNFQFFKKLVIQYQSDQGSEGSPVKIDICLKNIELGNCLVYKLKIKNNKWNTLELRPSQFGSGHALGVGSTKPVKWQDLDALDIRVPEGMTLNIRRIQWEESNLNQDLYVTLNEVIDDIKKTYSGMILSSHSKNLGVYYISLKKEFGSNLVFEQLDRSLSEVFKDFPSLNQPTIRPLYLIVFEDLNQGNEFWKQYGMRYGLNLSNVITSSGFNALGISSCIFDPLQGIVRPVYAHEILHSYIELNWQIGSTGNWIQEGMANYYQYHQNPMNPSTPNYKLFLNNTLEKKWKPLSVLMNGESIDVKDYPQISSVMDFIINNADLKKQFDQGLKRLRDDNSTNNNNLAESFFDMSLFEFEKKWLKWMAEKYTN
jgi:hypothetical protein